MNRTCEIHDTILQDDLKLRERPLKVLAAVDSFKGSMTSAFILSTNSFSETNRFLLLFNTGFIIYEIIFNLMLFFFYFIQISNTITLFLFFYSDRSVLIL